MNTAENNEDHCEDRGLDPYAGQAVESVLHRFKAHYISN